MLQWCHIMQHYANECWTIADCCCLLHYCRICHGTLCKRESILCILTVPHYAALCKHRWFNIRLHNVAWYGIIVAFVRIIQTYVTCVPTNATVMPYHATLCRRESILGIPVMPHRADRCSKDANRSSSDAIMCNIWISNVSDPRHCFVTLFFATRFVTVSGRPALAISDRAVLTWPLVFQLIRSTQRM